MLYAKYYIYLEKLKEKKKKEFNVDILGVFVLSQIYTQDRKSICNRKNQIAKFICKKKEGICKCIL